MTRLRLARKQYYKIITLSTLQSPSASIFSIIIHIKEILTSLKCLATLQRIWGF